MGMNLLEFMRKTSLEATSTFIILDELRAMDDDGTAARSRVAERQRRR